MVSAAFSRDEVVGQPRAGDVEAGADAQLALEHVAQLEAVAPREEHAGQHGVDRLARTSAQRDLVNQAMLTTTEPVCLIYFMNASRSVTRAGTRPGLAHRARWEAPGPLCEQAGAKPDLERP